jgi:hypothetical protein
MKPTTLPSLRLHRRIMSGRHTRWGWRQALGDLLAVVVVLGACVFIGAILAMGVRP